MKCLNSTCEKDAITMVAMPVSYSPTDCMVNPYCDEHAAEVVAVCHGMVVTNLEVPCSDD